MNSWKNIRNDGIQEIQRIVAHFEVFSEKVPYGKFKLKVIEKASGSFIAVPNLAIKDLEGSPEWISGFGTSVEEALKDAITYFLDTLEGKEYQDENNFEWAAPEDF